MKRNIDLFLLLVASSLALASCSKNSADNNGGTGNEASEDIVQELQVQIAPFKSVEGTKMSIDPETFQPICEAYDQMGFWPAINAFDGTTPDQAMFYVKPFSSDAESARFATNGWGLLRNLGYYSYYPYDEDAKYNEVALNYNGQRQYVNGDPSSICGFDFLHSVKTTVPEFGKTSFYYNHVGCIAEFNVTVQNPQQAGNFLSMILSTNSPYMVESAKYNPSSDNVVMQDKVFTDNMTLQLGRGNGIAMNDGKLKIFLMMSPAQWTDQTVTMTLYDSNGYEYSGTFTPHTQQEPGAHYVYNNINVSVSSTCRNLSALGTANCYIVSETGDYRFKAVKGNSDETVNMNGVKVLWETNNTNSAPSQNSIISNIGKSNGFITFRASGTEGNAVIAAYSNAECTGDVLWSWHIWCTDEPADEAYKNDAGYLMDRNLGALQKTGDCSEGLFYQWGRKDPFPSYYAFDINSKMTTTLGGSWPEAVDSDNSKGTTGWATAHPTTFVKGSSATNLDWIYSNNQPSLWYGGTDSKTVYDPCPPGYRIIEGSSDNSTVAGRGFWGKAFNTNVEITTYSDEGHYVTMPLLYGKAYYPKSGCINEDGTYSQWIDTFAFCWTNYPGGTNFDDNNWHSQYSGNLNYGTWQGDQQIHLSVNFNSGRAAGKAVRCMKMNNANPASDMPNEGFGTPSSSQW